MSLFDKSSLVLTPNGYKEGKLYSVKPTDGSGDLNVVRATTATRVNSDGLIESVDANVPRLDYTNGSCPSILLEPQRTNILPYSNDFSQNNWVKVNNAIVSATKVISPDGTLNASQIIFDGTSQGRIENAITGLTQGVDYTVSVYARVSSGTQVVSFGSVNAFTYTLTTEWQRLTSTEAENDTVGYPRLICNDAATIEIYGFQLEVGSYPTSYIPTVGSTVTRNADVATGAGDASTFNDSEGVLFAEYSDFDNDSFRQLTVSDGSNSNVISIMNTTTENQVVCFVNSGGVTQASTPFILNSTHEFNKISIKYKVNDFVVYINGFKIGTDTSVTVPSGLNTLNFNNGAGSGAFYGNVKQIQYFPTALNDSDLETLTSWNSFLDMATSQLYTIE